MAAKQVIGPPLTMEEVLDHLSARVDSEGMSNFCRRKECNISYLSQIIARKKNAGPAFLEALGYKQCFLMTEEAKAPPKSGRKPSGRRSGNSSGDSSGEEKPEVKAPKSKKSKKTVVSAKREESTKKAKKRREPQFTQNMS